MLTLSPQSQATVLGARGSLCVLLWLSAAQASPEMVQTLSAPCSGPFFLTVPRAEALWHLLTHSYQKYSHCPPGNILGMVPAELVRVRMLSARARLQPRMARPIPLSKGGTFVLGLLRLQVWDTACSGMEKALCPR